MKIAGKYACRVLLGLAVGLVASSARVAASEPVILPWTERQPFLYYNEAKNLKGILYDLGEKVFERARLPRRWSEIPANRIGMMLQEGDQVACMVGWFKTAERERIAKFSLPIYRDRPQIGVAPARSKIAEGSSLKTVLADLNLRVLVKQGYSYGAQIDELIAARQGMRVERVVGDHSQLLRMIMADRADLLLLTPEEVDHYRERNPEFAREARSISFSDAPDGNLRYIMCTRAVPDATVDALDAAIKATLKVK